MTTKESPQGDGTHLAAGSIQAQLNVLGKMVVDLSHACARKDERIRALEGAIRDLVAPADRASRLVEA